MALAMLTAAVAAGPYTTDVLHACMLGSWVSMAMMRRQMMVPFHEVFRVVPNEEFDSEAPVLRSLRRSAAQELLLAAALAPMFASNLAVPFLPSIFSTDASMAKGGITEAEFLKEVVEIAWRSADFKGGNPPMLTPSQALLSTHDEMFEEVGQGAEDFEQGSSLSVERPLGLRFDFIEVCGGAGTVTKRLIALSVVCGPVLDIAISAAYNVANPLVLCWLYYMMESGRLASLLVSPPCTTFSPAAYPPLRSYSIPMGFDVREPRTRQGNVLANAGLSLVFVGLRTRTFTLGEQPRRSKMRWLRQWRRLLSLGAREVHLASCMYGSIHQKEFTFLGAHMKVELLHRPCSRDHPHVRIQGGFTKASAVYCDGLADAVAELFRAHLAAKKDAERRLDIKTEGLEDMLSNEICLAGKWRTSQAWRWKKESHINILETHAVLRLLRSAAQSGGDCRLVYMCDSHVARSVITRGRSSAGSLRLVLEKISAVCLAYGIYPRGRFAPTRMNSADHPTRDSEIPAELVGLLLHLLPRHLVGALASISGLKRWSSNWARLALLLNPTFWTLSLSKLPPASMLQMSSALLIGLWTLTLPCGFQERAQPSTLLIALLCSCSAAVGGVVCPRLVLSVLAMATVLEKQHVKGFSWRVVAKLQKQLLSLERLC